MSSLICHRQGGKSVRLNSATALPLASAWLWNRQLLVQANCRGFTTVRYMQPEVTSYSRPPCMEAASFMQPEPPYYAHHPGRFFYLKDDRNGDVFSAPHEPVRRAADSFSFCARPDSVQWRVRQGDIEMKICLRLALNDPLELWSIKLYNRGTQSRQLSLYPCFSLGYLSWMNQSAGYNPLLGAIVARSVSPYQKLADLPRVLRNKSLTALLHSAPPTSWETRLSCFEGEGGLHHPDALQHPQLDNGSANYEVPVAVLQYREDLPGNGKRHYRFCFGPARDDDEIATLRSHYLGKPQFARERRAMRSHLQGGNGCLRMSSPETRLDGFANHWLNRQVFYHGDTQRMTSDPQTRNFLQDAMGMCFLQPDKARAALLLTLSQQCEDGALPDGVLLHEDASLQHINEVPHSDHPVWLPIALRVYLDETDDYTILDAVVVDGSGLEQPLFQRVGRALDWLLARRDARGLNYIGQGDWCDPMNMAGHLGRGVSTWLSQAAAYAAELWAAVCTEYAQASWADHYRQQAQSLREACNTHCWDGAWYCRGITDAGTPFGVSADTEGRLFLNPQSWAILARCADQRRTDKLLAAIEQQLETPFGAALLAPAYTSFRDDVGRVSQKFPGTAENGSIYNHATAFYCFALYQLELADRAFEVLMRMLPGRDDEDLLARGQLPTYLPNYYRGAWHQLPDSAGRSSHLHQTGTASWIYRILVESLFGLRGCRDGLQIRPCLPGHWQQARVTRLFRGATVEVAYKRSGVGHTRVLLDGVELSSGVLSHPQRGQHYQLEVELPGTVA